VGEEVLGTAAKVEVGKESTTIVGDGSSEDAVKARVSQIRNMVEQTDQDYEREKLNERIARLAGGVAIIQACHFSFSSGWRIQCIGACTQNQIKRRQACECLIETQCSMSSAICSNVQQAFTTLVIAKLAGFVSASAVCNRLLAQDSSA
jgi:hypothetical protein